ncbi:MAG: hypothetical protein R2865_05635 [Deinococcales bacterium]
MGMFLESDAPARLGDSIHSIGDVRSFREKIMTGSQAGELEGGESGSDGGGGRISSSAKAPQPRQDVSPWLCQCQP